MFTDMQQWAEIRRRVLVEGVSRRQVLRETGMHWKTLKKILENSGPPGYRQSQPRPRKKIAPYEDRIRQILKEDKAVLPKQRHTAKRIFERLQKEGYAGGYTAVKEAVREMEQRSREVFVPLAHPPGEAQVDFGYALVKMNGQLSKVAFFVMTLPYSDAFFVMAFERECTETFFEGHVRGFEFFGGVLRFAHSRGGVQFRLSSRRIVWQKHPCAAKARMSMYFLRSADRNHGPYTLDQVRQRLPHPPDTDPRSGRPQCGLPVRLPIKSLHKAQQCQIVGPAKLPEFHDIYAAFTRFAFRDERLRAPEPDGGIRLSQPRADSCGSQFHKKTFVIRRIQRFSGGRFARHLGDACIGP